MAESKKPPQSIEELRRRYDELNRDKITAAANYENARRQLDDLKVRARAEYETDDLEALREKLKQMEAENERKRSEYQAHLEQIDADLRDVDRKFSKAPGEK